MTQDKKTGKFRLVLDIELSPGADRVGLSAALLRSIRSFIPGIKVEAVPNASPEHADVKAFDRRYLIPNSTRPAWLDPAAAEFRHKFIQEEVDELLEAYDQRDMAKYFDALLDLVWVAHGTATMMGLPWQAGWQEVVRANMSKERATGPDDPRSKRKSALDVVKPDGWREPDHSQSLWAHEAEGGFYPTLDTEFCAQATLNALGRGEQPSNRFEPNNGRWSE